MLATGRSIDDPMNHTLSFSMAAISREPDPYLPIPDDRDCGEAMRALTRPQRAFVTALVQVGGAPKKHTECAMRAGYGNNPRSAETLASNMMRNPKIIAALKEETERLIKGSVLLGASVLAEIAGDPMHKDRFKAGLELARLSGFITETKHTVTVEDHRDRVQLQDEVRELLNRASQQRLVLPAPLEGEFVEVPRDPNDISDLLAPV